MMSKEKLLKICEECLDEMYRHSTPPITWKEYLERYGNTNIQGFTKHSLSMKEYDKIYSKYIKKVPKYHRSQFAITIMNYAPTFPDLEKDSEQ